MGIYNNDSFAVMCFHSVFLQNDIMIFFHPEVFHLRVRVMRVTLFPVFIFITLEVYPKQHVSRAAASELCASTKDVFKD